ncbi:MAG: methyltransferase domain-containing protein [Anaerolineae bacterium]|nr:methyltransferase domain-containing protein [Anaerolineae bacterium]
MRRGRLFLSWGAKIVLGIVAGHTVIRVVRHVYKFPIPEFMANLIDNPLRRRLQPPDETAARHGLRPGMVALEVGPGNGRYTLAAARHVGPGGRVVAIDIEPRMVERVARRAAEEGVDNVEARVADVYRLPWVDGTFDAAYMMAVIGEIPEPERALRELHRVLRPGGTLALSELLMDPDYPLSSTLVRWGEGAGFRVKEKVGNMVYYTLILAKPGEEGL